MSSTSSASHLASREKILSAASLAMAATAAVHPALREVAEVSWYSKEPKISKVREARRHFRLLRT